MSARGITLVLGLFVLGNGLFGLINPEGMMRTIGFVPDPSKPQPGAAFSEIRAAFGGALAMQGVWLLLATLHPRRYRDGVLLLACLWIAGGGGRLVSLQTHGDPGFYGWVAIAAELIVGVALVVAWWGMGEARLAATTVDQSGVP